MRTSIILIGIIEKRIYRHARTSYSYSVNRVILNVLNGLSSSVPVARLARSFSRSRLFLASVALLYTQKVTCMVIYFTDSPSRRRHRRYSIIVVLLPCNLAVFRCERVTIIILNIYIYICFGYFVGRGFRRERTAAAGRLVGKRCTGSS